MTVEQLSLVLDRVELGRVFAVCAHCGESFSFVRFPGQPGRKSRRFCSEVCKSAFGWERRRLRAEERRLRETGSRDSLRLQRFRANIGPPDGGGCQLWLGRVALNGSFGKGGTTTRVDTHVCRQVYEQANGPVPAGTQLHHLCGNRMCVRGEHLVALTPSEHLRLHAVEALGYRPGFDSDDWMWAA